MHNWTSNWLDPDDGEGGLSWFSLAVIGAAFLVLLVIAVWQS